MEMLICSMIGMCIFLIVSNSDDNAQDIAAGVIE
jgi:hypothetical protein